MNNIEKVRNAKIRRDEAVEQMWAEREAKAKDRFYEETSRYNKLVREVEFDREEIDIYEWDKELVLGYEFKTGLGHKIYMFFYELDEGDSEDDGYAIIEAGQQCYIEDRIDDDGVVIRELRIPTAQNHDSRYEWHEIDVREKNLGPLYAQELGFMASELELLSGKIEVSLNS